MFLKKYVKVQVKVKWNWTGLFGEGDVVINYEFRGTVVPI
jgi:hypothetical protein